MEKNATMSVSTDGGKTYQEFDPEKIDTALTALEHPERIIKVKVKGNTLELESDEHVLVGETNVTNHYTRKFGYQVHEDLLNAFAELAVHLLILTEIIDPEHHDIEQIKAQHIHLLEKITVTGYSIGGEDEYMGVTLIGQRKLASKKVFNIIAPFTQWEDPNNPYEYILELSEAIRNVDNEIVAYLNGKYAPNLQMELDFKDA